MLCGTFSPFLILICPISIHVTSPAPKILPRKLDIMHSIPVDSYHLLFGSEQLTLFTPLFMSFLSYILYTKLRGDTVSLKVLA